MLWPTPSATLSIFRRSDANFEAAYAVSDPILLYFWFEPLPPPPKNVADSSLSAPLVDWWGIGGGSAASFVENKRGWVRLVIDAREASAIAFLTPR